MKVLAVSRQLHSVNLTIVAWVEYLEPHGQSSAPTLNTSKPDSKESGFFTSTGK
ncbi:hypothetical protein PUND_a3162 [Pseudoalteromonas undina]|nr:hypothetical protein PUND_a3162 [Pseudoalteromonas undina]